MVLLCSLDALNRKQYGRAKQCKNRTEVTAGDGQTWSNPGATALKPVIANTYAIYRDVITAPGFANGTIDTQFVGLDLGW